MFQLTYNNTVLISKTVPEAILLGIIIGAVILLIIASIWKKLRDSDRLKYEFITIIAHKFRTPLTYIKWSSDGLLKEETDSYKKQSLGDIQHANENLIKLTGTLLELSDPDATPNSSYIFTRTDLCSFVKTIIDGYKGIFHEKNIFLSFSCSEEHIMSKIDTARMEFVLQTLLDNARTYTPTGRNVEVSVSRSGHKAIISVTDHGIGISDRDKARLFTKFFRAENAKRTDTEGFGVGLYLAQTVAERHHGKIEASSEGQDKGSTFTVTLPLDRKHS